MSNNLITRAIDISYALYEKNRVKQEKKNNHHVSVVFFKNKVVAIGENSIKTHPINLLNPRFDRRGNNIASIKGTCSELAAFLVLKNKTGIKTENCVLVNIRIDNNGRLAYSRPCKSCESLLKYLNFKRVFYSINLINNTSDIPLFAQYFSYNPTNTVSLE